MSEHKIKALGLTEVTVRDGKVVEVGEPEIEYCPLFNKYQNIEKLTSKEVAKNIQFRIDDFGMCTPNRQLRMKDFLSFGISEIISTLLDENVVDCAIMVCEGTGTLLIYESELAQGIGGRVSALVETSPIPEIIDEIGEENILDAETAKINQAEGVELAIKKGHENIAVTVTEADDAVKIRELRKLHPDVNIYVFVVHTSKKTKKEAEILFDVCDVATGCASKNMREIGEKNSLKTVGQSIPIFSHTKDGERFIEMRLEKIGGEKPKKKDARIPNPLI